MAKPSKNKQKGLIEKEIRRLNDIFTDLSESKHELAQGLIKRLAHMTIQLEILEDTVQTKGPTYLFVNGSQKMLVENPVQKSYNTTMQRYTAAYDKLFSLLDELEKVDNDDDEEL
ncbi:hypothetical protein [Pseudobacillus badius]|uniref:hypothetical protein n=1 Tax=Bacillus badius TaxID=1455 RepID=UPI0007B3ECFE|nr:hypothetical protein [Bacillus badius]KZR58355.1 hypothetical protein A3781_17305 [Bacillus badius]